MSVRVMDEEDVPKRKRVSVPRIMQTPDWLEAQSKLAVGIVKGKPVVIVFSPEEMKRYGIKNIRKSSIPIKEYIKRLGLPYSVEARTTSEGGTVIIRNQAEVASRRA